MSVPESDMLPMGEPTPPENPNGLRGFDVLGQFLADDGWYAHRLEGKHAFTMGFTGKNGDLRCYATIRVDVEQFIFYAVSPVKVPEELRPAVAEFTARANFGLRIGNFELDFSDGEVRYKSSLDFEDIALTPELLRNHIYPAVQTMDRYLPGLMRVTYGGATPLEAIQEIEGE